MPNARRVIFSTYVVPTQSLEMEETSMRKTTFQSSPNRTLGGGGIATINATQWGDGWTSFSHRDSNWEDHGDNWNVYGESWDGLLDITSTPVQLTSDTSDLAFLYIRNTFGSTMSVSLNGTSGNYYIEIPSGGSVHLRGDGTNLECNEVYVKSSGKAKAEWIIAKE